MEYEKIVDALRETLDGAMHADERVILLGEDIGVLGGAYGVTRGLMEKYGEHRVRDTPISENVIVGLGVGSAIAGYRPVVEMQFIDFAPCAMDQICNQAAKLRFMMGGQVSVPMVIRAAYGSTGRAAQHSQSLEAWFAHTPGLKVVMPTTPYDARGLLLSAIDDPNPVLFLEHKLLYGGASAGGAARSAVTGLGEAYKRAPSDDYRVPIGKAEVRRHGSDVSIFATGMMVYHALSASYRLNDEGIYAEVIDLRSISPLDEETILESVRKTGRAIIASEDVKGFGVSAEVSALIAEKALYDLDAPVARVAVDNTSIPFAPNCEEHAVPGANEIYAAARGSVRAMEAYQ